MQAEQFGPYSRPGKSQMLAYRTKRGQNRLKYPFAKTNELSGPILGWKRWNKVGTPIRLPDRPVWAIYKTMYKFLKMTLRGP